MWLINTALRRPVTILIIVIGVALGSILALIRMPVDIFPNLNLPVIYVAQPYGGMDPAQMEGYLVSYYECHFLYITGIEHVESKSIQNVGLIKLSCNRSWVRSWRSECQSQTPFSLSRLRSIAERKDRLRRRRR